MVGRVCKCGCKTSIQSSKRYVNKEHQLAHMRDGEARRLNERQPIDAKRRGGRAAGKAAVESGRLADAGQKGAARAREIAELLRRAG